MSNKFAVTHSVVAKALKILPNQSQAVVGGESVMGFFDI